MFSPLISGPWGDFQFPTLCGILLHDLTSFHSLSTQLFPILLMSYNSKTTVRQDRYYPFSLPLFKQYSDFIKIYD